MATPPAPLPPRAPSTPDLRLNRAALTNGRLLPNGLDGRSTEARRWKDLHRAYAAATSLDIAYTVVDGRIRTLVGVTMALERIGAQQARGAPYDPTELVALANSQGRLMQELGLSPTSEPETPAASDPVAAHRKRMGWDR